MHKSRGEMLKENFGAIKWTLMKFFGYYPVLAPLSMFCVLFSAIVAAIPADFIQKILAVIQTWVNTGDWASARAELLPYIFTLIGLYLVSICSLTLETQLMAIMTQGFLDKMRREMFNGMQNLPIRYFDSHKHGDIMSFYTNDIDTLRQLVSGSLPSLVRSVSVVLAVFFIMLWYSLWMTLVLLVGVAAMFFVTKTIGGSSAKYFMSQQKAVGAMEGFAQETMNGQKVVKVFCHEQQSIEDFDKVNAELYEVSYKANAFASTLGPIIANIGNILYVGLALAGGVFILTGVPSVSLSGLFFDITVLIPFLNMARQFTGNVNQLSQQINSIVMAGAGAQRILSLINEAPETDDGYVTLVNARLQPDGSVVETQEHTGHWAWRHPHTADGSVTYTPLRGDVRMVDVDFAYVEGKNVLEDISVYAEPGQKVAFVGATGAGKTTITNLINRFYDIADGKIRRQDPLRRHQRQQDQKGRPAPLPGHRSAGDQPLHRHRAGEYPLRQPLRQPGRLHPGGQAGRRGRLHHPSAPGLRHRAAQQRRQPLPGPAAAAGHRPGRRGGPACDDPGRGHLLHRHPHRGHCPAGHGQADGGTDRFRHRPPAFHGHERGRDHGAGPRPHHRAGQPREAPGREGHLLSALYRRLRAGVSAGGYRF